MKYLLLLAAFGLAACQTVQTTPNKPATFEVPAKPAGRISFQWEVDPVNKSREPWSAHMVPLIRRHLPEFKKGDWVNHCPKWNSLTEDQQVHVIGVDIVATILNESAYKPTSRMRETTMDIDPVTGVQVWSEGLLQLSYQDVPNYGEKLIPDFEEVCKIDWKKDKGLSPTDPKKTILDPYINLTCGITILANEIDRKKVVYYDGSYWAVRRPKGKYTKVPQIKAKIAAYAKECF
jgi:hypothetical protein